MVYPCYIDGHESRHFLTKVSDISYKTVLLAKRVKTLAHENAPAA